MKCSTRWVAALLLMASQPACGDSTPVGPESREAIFSIGPPPGTPIPSAAARPPLCRGGAGHRVVGFEDANLEAAVRSALGVGGEEDLTCGLLSGLTILNAADLGVQSLAGIENLSGLTRLDLRDNPDLSDLRPISYLTGLTDLNVGVITSLPPQSGMGSISDLTPLVGLRNLERLYAHGNSVTDISALGGLTALRTLSLAYNFITDISPLSGLTNLNSLLTLSGNHITDLSALRGLTGLRQLWIAENPASDLSPLSALTNLEQLYANQALISDVGPLQYLTSLWWLLLAGNADLSDIQPLIANTGLDSGDYVDLRGTKVSCTDVAALEAKDVTVFSDCK